MPVRQAAKGCDMKTVLTVIAFALVILGVCVYFAWLISSVSKSDSFMQRKTPVKTSTDAR